MALIVIVFYLGFMRKTALTFKDAYGLFWNDRYKPLVESVVNLGVSIVLGKLIGINGIFLGTIISTVTTCLWIEPYVLFKHAFHKKLHVYFGHFLKYLFVSFVTIITLPCDDDVGARWFHTAVLSKSNIMPEYTDYHLPSCLS